MPTDVAGAPEDHQDATRSAQSTAQTRQACQQTCHAQTCSALQRAMCADAPGEGMRGAAAGTPGARTRRVQIHSTHTRARWARQQPHQACACQVAASKAPATPGVRAPSCSEQGVQASHAPACASWGAVRSAVSVEDAVSRPALSALALSALALSAPVPATCLSICCRLCCRLFSADSADCCAAASRCARASSSCSRRRCQVKGKGGEQGGQPCLILV